MTLERDFGVLSSGVPVKLFTIENTKGCSVMLCNYGARIVSVIVPDANGCMGDVVLGYPDIKGYEDNNGYFGAVCGRCANRLSQARFKLNGEIYKLSPNNFDKNTLHGGINGFDKKIWRTKMTEDSVIFSCDSPDGEEGFPGNLSVTVCYTFNESNELTIVYEAICDQDTVVNLTNHAYFNMDGHNGESATEQELVLYADYYTPVKKEMLLTGEIISVAGTVFDFTTEKKIGGAINEKDPQLITAGGYDHNYVLCKSERNSFEKAAKLKSKSSGRVMEVYTNQPGIQFYAGNNVTRRTGKEGVTYGKRPGNMS